MDHDEIVEEAKQYSQQVRATDKEKKFIDLYKQAGYKNATRIARIVFDCNSDSSASAVGSRLVKKFGLKRRVTVAEIPGESSEHGKTQRLVAMFADGKITPDYLFLQLAEVAFHDVDAKARVPALRLLMEWREKIEAQEKAKVMPEKEVTDLLIDALSKIPRSKYIEVLKGCRAKRLVLIKERNKVIPVDELLKEGKGCL